MMARTIGQLKVPLVQGTAISSITPAAAGNAPAGMVSESGDDLQAAAKETAAGTASETVSESSDDIKMPTKATDGSPTNKLSCRG
jgi:hypothetical protein